MVLCHDCPRKFIYSWLIHLWLISHHNSSWVVVTEILWSAIQNIYCLTLYRKTSLTPGLEYEIGYIQSKSIYEKLYISCKRSIMLLKTVTLTADSRGQKGTMLESGFEQAGKRPNYSQGRITIFWWRKVGPLYFWLVNTASPSCISGCLLHTLKVKDLLSCLLTIPDAKAGVIAKLKYLLFQSLEVYHCFIVRLVLYFSLIFFPSIVNYAYNNIWLLIYDSDHYVNWNYIGNGNFWSLMLR